MRRPRRLSRKARLDMAGAALILASLAGCAGFTSYAVKADAARGLSVSESLCTAGIGCTAAERGRIVAELRGEAPAVPARLIGECGGRILAATEESSFPAGCAWIEPIRYESEVTSNR